jgi:hypothetical protein
MAIRILDHTGTKSAEVEVQSEEATSEVAFEVEFSEGFNRRFKTAEDVRTAILLGQVPERVPSVPSKYVADSGEGNRSFRSDVDQD